MRLWPSGLRHPIQPPALLWLPGAAGGAGCTDPHCDAGAWRRGSPSPGLPIQHGGARGTTQRPPRTNQSHEYAPCIINLLIFAQSTGPENLFVNYLSRIHREEVIQLSFCKMREDLPCKHVRSSTFCLPLGRTSTSYWRAWLVCWPTPWLRLTCLTLPRRSSSTKSFWCFSGSCATSIRLEKRTKMKLQDVDLRVCAFIQQNPLCVPITEVPVFCPEE